MDIRTIVGTILAAAAGALMVGVGALAWQVGATWDSENTSAAIVGLVSVCGGAALVLAILLSVVVGAAFWSRLNQQMPMPARPRYVDAPPAGWGDAPPLLPPGARPLLPDQMMEPPTPTWTGGGQFVGMDQFTMEDAT